MSAAGIIPRKKCSVAECERAVDARGFCQFHYRRWMRGADLTAPPYRSKTGPCSVAECERPYSCRGFCRLHYRRWMRVADLTAPHRSRTGPDDLTKTCQYCDKVVPVEECTAGRRACKKCALIANRFPRDKTREIAQLYDTQAACLMCGREGIKLVMDHDHSCCPGNRSCGKCFRGLICQRCNHGLHFIEDEAFPTAASAYLARANA